MRDLWFAWDDDKNRANQRQHGMSFEEAQTVFYDDRALLIEDPDDTHLEHRFVLLGLSDALRTLLVCHCYREDESVIRIISARKAHLPTTNEGGDDEKALRLLEGETQPLCEA
ncbi:MAG: BrnT family toxin, partial [Nitrososphaera sp.]